MKTKSAPQFASARHNLGEDGFFTLRVLIGLAVVLVGVFLALAGSGLLAQGFAKGQQQNLVITHSDNPLVPVPFDCSNIERFNIDKQLNMRAQAIMIACGRAEGASSASASQSLLGLIRQSVKKLISPLVYGTTDVDVITGAETYPNIHQSTTFTVGNSDNPLQMLVAYTDLRGGGASPPNGSGASWSTDGGNTFVRLTGSDGQSPFSGTSGDPVALYHRPTQTWYTIWYDTICPGLGGYKTATPGDVTSWTHFCVVTSPNSIDRPGGWQDNNPSSPYYGRMYVSYNDFSVGAGALFVRWSSDAGATWNQVEVNSTFIRNVQLTCDSINGNVYLMGMNEGGGGCGTTRQNVLYKSTNGGVTWSNSYSGPNFAGPCRTNVGYFADMYNNPAYWRYMGWGQPAAYNGSVYYVYAACGNNCPGGTDPGDIFFIRSTDGGNTFGAPVKLNTDGDPTKGQWGPALSVASDGSLFATWYDERERISASCQPSSADNPCYRIWARKSTDGGATWQPDMPFSDAISPLPVQPNQGIIPVYVEDYDFANSVLTMHLHAWTDGRVLAVNGVPQADVFHDREPGSLAPLIVSAVSRKTHGAAGTFDIDMPLTGNSGVECRTSGETNDYTLVVAFSGNVTVSGSPQAQVTGGTGCVGSGGSCTGNVTVSGTVVTVPLTNIADQQVMNVRINGVNGAADQPATDFNIPMGILIGDTNANRTVNAADVAQTKERLGQTVDGTNFRSDVNANGTLNAADVAIVKAKVGTGLP